MTAWCLHFLGELVWTSFACFGYPDVIDLGEQLLLELMSCVFGTIYSGFVASLGCLLLFMHGCMKFL